MSRMIVLPRPSSFPCLLGAGLIVGSMLVWSGGADAAAAPDSFADLAKKVSPAVVNIAIEKDIQTGEQNMPEFPPGSPFDEFFKHFRERFGQDGSDHSTHRRMLGQGSGFVIDPSGYIVTNNHVVDSADEVKVRLEDNSTFNAKVIGVDPLTDLALIKVDAGRPLPSVDFGDSDKAEVGDWVLAVGNPFGLGGTVTAGIISARGRNIQAGPYDDFLQVDASINRGNSGGPLFNTNGKVIGVNTAIFSPNGGSVGIGFAIPSNLAKSVIASLKANGKVDRGWLGVQIQKVTPEIAESLGLDKPEGALVASVESGSPAEKAGLKQGDVVIGFAGKPIDSPRTLARVVAEKPAGSKTSVEIWRKNNSETLAVVTGEHPVPEHMASLEGGGGSNSSQSFHSKTLNADLASLNDLWRKRLDISADVNGVVVVKVDDGLALKQGLREGDVIVQVADAKVETPQSLEDMIEKAKQHDEKAVLLLVNRQGRDLFLGLRLDLA